MTFPDVLRNPGHSSLSESCDCAAVSAFLDLCLPYPNYGIDKMPKLQKKKKNAGKIPELLSKFHQISTLNETWITFPVIFWTTMLIFQAYELLLKEKFSLSRRLIGELIV